MVDSKVMAMNFDVDEDKKQSHQYLEDCQSEQDWQAYDVEAHDQRLCRMARRMYLVRLSQRQRRSLQGRGCDRLTWGCSAGGCVCLDESADAQAIRRWHGG